MAREASQVISAAAMLLVAYLVFLVFRPFAAALVFAVVMAVMLQPVQARLERHMRRSWAAAVSTTLVVVVVIIPAVVIAARVVSEAIDLAGNFKDVPFDALLARAQRHAGRVGLDLGTLARDGVQRVAGQAGVLASRLVLNVWDLLVGLAIAILATFFLFRDGDRLVAIVVYVLPMPRDRSAALVREVGAMIHSNIAASLAAAAIQGTMGALAFAWFGLPGPVLWGVVMGFFCMFPIVGAWLVWGPAAAALLVSGRTWDAVLLVVIGVAVVHPVDNMLRPAMVAHSTRLNGLLVLIGLLGGVQAFGVAGLLLGPVLISVAAALVSTYFDADHA